MEDKACVLQQNLDDMLDVLCSDSSESREGWQMLAKLLAASKLTGEELESKCKPYIPLLRRCLKIPLIRLLFEYVIGLTSRFFWLKKR